MILHSYIVSLTTAIVASLEMASVKTLSVITAGTKRNISTKAAA
jgi:hypothetical protein